MPTSPFDAMPRLKAAQAGRSEWLLFFASASSASKDSQYCRRMVVRPSHDSACRKPRSLFPASSRIMRGMAIATGNHLCSFQNRLMRMPMRNTTTSPSMAAVIRLVMTSEPTLVRDRAVARIAHEGRVLRQHASGVLRLRLPPLRLAPRDLGLAYVQLDEPLLRVDRDGVAFLHQGDRPAVECFRRHVPHYHSPGAAGEAPVGDDAHGLAEALANESGSGREHFAHAGPAFRALVADDEHIARLDLVGEDRIHGRGLAFEHARGPPDRPALQ